MRLPSRIAFTLVELLVVIAIIGILVALLLPAVQAARQAARRLQCVNNFKQVALGMHNYHSAQGTFPPGWMHAESDCGLNFFYEGFGWGAFVLPYIEQQYVYENLVFDGVSPRRVKDVINGGLDAAGATINTFLCPEDPQADPRVEVTGLWGHNQFSCPQRLQDDHGRSNMAGIADSLDWTCSTRLNTNSRFPDPKANGILRGWETVRIADITDGTTKTLLVGEVTGAGPGTCQGFRWSAHGIMDVAGGINGAGSLPGNGQYLGKNGTFSSYHPGGCHFALADGSARFLSQDIDQLTLQSLAGRNDGAIVEGY